MVSIHSADVSQLLTRNISEAGDSFGTALERISSGLRINRSSDDPAGLAVANKLNADVRQYTAAIRNGNDAISSLQLADSGLGAASQILTQIEEIIGLAGNGTLTSSELASLQSQADELVDEYNRIISSTEFNSKSSFAPNQPQTTISLGKGSTLSYTQGDALEREVGTSEFTKLTGIGGATQDFEFITIDEDGLTDVIYIANAGTSVSFSLNNGDGTFSPATTYAVTFTVGDLATGDFNNDGREDFVVTSVKGGGAAYEVFLNQGDSFATQGKQALLGDGSKVSAGDFNDDGLVDLVLINDTNFTAYLEGNGDGSFAAVASTGIAIETELLETGDFNGDGIPDLLLGDSGSNTADIYISDGNFGFTHTDSVVIGATSLDDGADIADVNFDGIDDIAVSDGGTSGSVLILGSNGQVQQSTSFSAMDYDTVFGDFNSDGHLDVGGLNNATEFHVAYGDGQGGFTSSSLVDTISSGVSTHSLKSADLNGDGVDDLLHGATSGSPSLSAFINGTELQSDIQYLNLQSSTGRTEAQSVIDLAQTKLANEQAVVGANLSRLEFALSNLSSIRAETSAGVDRIRNADLAIETANLVKSEILKDAATAAFAQFNQNRDTVLALLAGSGIGSS